MIKLIFDEPGSDLAVELWDRAESVVSSQLIYPEARAAAAAAHRGGRIDSSTLQRATERVDELCGQMRTIGLDFDRAHAAGDLAETHALRGYDAVHLATALRIGTASLLFVTWDRDLAPGALAAGCTVSPPPAQR